VDDSTDELVLHVRGGEIGNEQAWIYAWLRLTPTRPVIYVGATGLNPALRAWLHLHDGDPEVGRVAANYAAADTEPLDVVAVRLPPDVPRQRAKQAAIDAVARRGLLADAYFGNDPAAEEFTHAVAEQGERLASLVVSHCDARRAELARPDLHPE
jgi:hypothetical protein